MAKLYIREYITQGPDTGGHRFPAGQEPGVDQAPITIAAGAAASAAFASTTRLIRVHTDAICSILISAAGDAATANNARLAANQTEFFGVFPGHKLSVITNT